MTKLFLWLALFLGLCISSFAQPIIQPLANTNFNQTAIPFTLYRGGDFIRTNFIGGQLYTNNYGQNLYIEATISNVVANVAGASRTALWIYPQAGLAGIAGTTNFFGDYHQAMGATVAYTNLGTLGALWPAGQVASFTNQSSGAGNDSKVMNGQIWIP